MVVNYFFLDPNRGMTVVDIETEPGLRFRTAQPLFVLPDDIEVFDIAILYDVTPDDQRFIMARMNLGAEGSDARPDAILVTNFFEELRQVVPD